jgi:hypothetical protein
LTALGRCLLLAILAAGLPPTLVQSQQIAGTRVGAGGDLQAALNAAKPGDTVLLAPGAEFVGNFTLPARMDRGNSFITIRTEGSGLPESGVRTGPQFAGKLAVIRSPTPMPALSTARGTHHWRIENVEFGANRTGANEVIALGSGERAQRAASDVPHDLVLDRILLRGDQATGQKRGIALNSGATQILNSYIADVKVLGVDGQAIGGWNGPGPFVIENNYLEASGENVMFGGSDPWIEQLIPTDITIRWNHFARPVSWREPIVAPPASVRVATCRADCGDSSLPRGSYTYSVVAERAVAGATANSAPMRSVQIAVDSGAVEVQWTQVPGASAYRVFRHAGNGETSWRETTTRFIDSGRDGVAEAPPKRGSVWSVKNLLELKNARDVVIEGNLFEHHWPQAQAGYAIVFTPRNQNGRAPWSTVANIRFANNVVRRVSGGINISGTDDDRPSGRTAGITIENNLFVDIGGATWGEPGDFVQIGNGPVNVHIERNTAVQSGRALVVYGSRHGAESPGFVFRDNVVRHNRYGLFGADAGTGRPAIARYFPGGVVAGNVFAGGSASEYPDGNRFLAADALDVVAEAGDLAYRLKNPRAFRDVGAALDTLHDAGVRPRTSAPASPAAPRRRTD